MDISAGGHSIRDAGGWALSLPFCSCWWPSLRGSLNATCKIIPPHENAHILFIGRSDVFWLSIGRFDVFWLCIGASGVISLSANLLRREVAGISDRFVAHRLAAGQILPSGIRRFLQASNRHEACLYPETIHLASR